MHSDPYTVTKWQWISAADSFFAAKNQIPLCTSQSDTLVNGTSMILNFVLLLCSTQWMRFWQYCHYTQIKVLQSSSACLGHFPLKEKIKKFTFEMTLVCWEYWNITVREKKQTEHNEEYEKKSTLLTERKEWRNPKLLLERETCFIEFMPIVVLWV